MEQIGFIGLGRMGLPMATNLLKQGYQLACFDVIEEQLNLAVENGGKDVALWLKW